MYPVQLECMAGVIPPFATMHVSCHKAFESLYSTLYMSGLMRWASYRQIDDLDKNSFYFVIHFESEGRSLALAVCMHNSIDMVIVSNA